MTEYVTTEAFLYRGREFRTLEEARIAAREAGEAFPMIGFGYVSKPVKDDGNKVI